MNNKLPNFLIVGAAKSGTTSLYHYLNQHPEIYMSPMKETRFFIRDFYQHLKNVGGGEVTCAKTFEEYQDLFKGVKDEKAIGEATPSYLSQYHLAIPDIKKTLGSPKIIMVLRNPISRAYSAYKHIIRDSSDNLSFEQALKMEKTWKEKGMTPLHYLTEAGFYYGQVKAYLDNFDQVKVYLHRDLKESPEKLLKDLHGFLEVDSSFMPNINTRHNLSGLPKYKTISKFINRPNPLKSVIRPVVKRLVTHKTRERLVTKIKNKNVVKSSINPETKKRLIELYRQDIKNLQGLINKDLSSWLK